MKSLYHACSGAEVTVQCLLVHELISNKFKTLIAKTIYTMLLNFQNYQSAVYLRSVFTTSFQAIDVKREEE